MELINAQWKIEEGRTVDLRLAGDGFDRVHPFKKFQKKRAGRVGTRFHMVCATEDGQVVLNGEVMFAGWSDTSSKGQIVKFWLDDEASTHPFAGFRPRGRDGIGTIFGVALVEMTDDDKPVDQVAEKSLAEAHGKPRKRGLSQDAHFMIINEKFIQYVRETVNLKPGTEVNAELARRWVKHRLQIESLGDLDHNPEKAKLFHQVIRRPYARWNGEDC